MTDVDAALRALAAQFEQALPAYLPPDDGLVTQAMRYSLQGGGKRIRPALVLLFCRLFGGNTAEAMPFAAALEMIHTYSLIHDDLPCMDNDDYRRGRLSCHRRFGEATALLAGDALLTQAFGCLCGAEALLDAQRCAAAAVLAQAAGPQGMIAGQQLDLRYEGQKIDRARLEEMNRLKTGALLQAACRLGCLAAGATAAQTNAALCYGGYLGLLFQVTDDLLDVTGSKEKTGKSQGKDAKSGKSTWVALLGLRRAQMYAKELAALAQGAIKDECSQEDLLFCLPAWLAQRDH
jgi:geranylgeranyl diphosphate synthase type II